MEQAGITCLVERGKIHTLSGEQHTFSLTSFWGMCVVIIIIIVIIIVVMCHRRHYLVAVVLLEEGNGGSSV